MIKKLLFTLIAFSCLPMLAQPGFTCSNPITITSLPFSTTDNTANYGDTSDVTQPPLCVGTSSNYMTGNDVFYRYTPTASGNISVSMTPTGSWSGIFVYDGCANVGVNCLAGVANSGSAPRVIPAISVIAGHTYIFVISTNATPQTTGYSLNIQSINCASPQSLTVSAIGDQTAYLEWGNPGNASSWQVAVQPAGAGTPASGVTVNGSPNFTAAGLSSITQYEYWVRAACGYGNFSSWSGPKNFTTSSCSAANQCNYTFQAIDSFGDGWNGNTMSVSQGGVVVSTISLANSQQLQNFIVPLCDGQPFELFWNAGGQFPSEVGISIRNAFGQTIYQKAFGTGAQNSSLYTNVANCLTPACIPPTNISQGILAGNNVTFTWDDFAGGQWEAILLPTGSPVPEANANGTIATTNSFTAWVTTAVSYTVYVRTVCENGTSSWASSTFTPPCPAPTNLAVNSPNAASANLSWTETGTAAQWEVAVMPANVNFQVTQTGALTNTNSYTVTGLSEITNYKFYVRAVCSSNVNSGWSGPFNFWQSADNPPVNDECQAAIWAPVNSTSACMQTISGTVVLATSTEPLPGPQCMASTISDVWYRFVATEDHLKVSVSNPLSGSVQYQVALYSGSCGSLSVMGCGAGSILGNNLIVGQTYYVRVAAINPDVFNLGFILCVAPPATCDSGTSVCGVQNYANITGMANSGQVGCLFTTPNGSYFSIKIGTSGSIKLNITQSSLGSTTPNLDVDYAAWGPFASLNDACNVVSGGGLPSSGCSYSASATEHFNIANAQAGEYYIVLITNFSNKPGFINLNFDPTSTGSIDCSGIRLNAFLDSNNNGTQDSGEISFPLGQFQYEANNDGNIHNVISPSGVYTIYDSNITNTYDLGYVVNSDYSSMYGVSAIYSNIQVSNGAMATYNFPITILQNYSDVGISVNPVNTPRVGANYKNRIVFTNNGNQTIASGILNFNKDPNTTITDISQPGIAITANGFNYTFSNLLPFESRSILVTMSVPTIPTISIGQLLTNTATIAPPGDDAVGSNNNSSSTQAVIAAYDPNDKMEAHGEKIQLSTFSANDYLQYTIRFENTGNTSATNISLVDALDTQLDETSLVMVSASHNYTLDRVARNLTWKFDEINLPVSVAGLDIGKGYVTFKIKLKPGFAAGDVIPNTASIYFDTNPAIVTNTFNTEFVAFLANTQFDDDNLVIYPNPASGHINIGIQNSAVILQSVAIYDLVGKAISRTQNISAGETTIDVSSLSTGIYLIEITTGNHMKLVRKLVIK